MRLTTMLCGMGVLLFAVPAAQPAAALAPMRPVIPEVSPDAEAPHVVGRQVNEAVRILRDWNPNRRIDPQVIGALPEGADSDYGTVQEQSAEGRTITLDIVGRIPDLTGSTRAEAERLLTRSGMRGAWQPEDVDASAVVTRQDPPPGTAADWLTEVSVFFEPASTGQPSPTRTRSSQVRVPQLLGLSVTDARVAAQRARVRLVLTPESAEDDDLITGQRPPAGRLVSRGARVAVVAEPAQARTTADPPTTPAPGVPDPGSEIGPESTSVPAVLAIAGAAVPVLIVLLGLLALALRAPKRAGWVHAHVHAQAVSDTAGQQTTSQSQAGGVSVRIRTYLDPGRHRLEEISP